jgi:pimeloyl-ACP methyl ester carboxylesterase
MWRQFILRDGRGLGVREYLAAEDRGLWLVGLPGSGLESWDFDWRERRSLLGGWGGGVHLLMVNKPGLDEEGRVRDAAEFERSFRREMRVRDYAEFLRRRIPAGDRILLLGFSEGAYLAPDLARRDRRVRALALLSGGTRSWLDEEVYKSARPAQALARVARVYGRPHSRTQGWCGLSNATWMSYDCDTTFESLRRLDIPVFTAHGLRDRLVDVHSVLADLTELRRRHGKAITSRVYPNADHTLGTRWLTALRAAGLFLRRHAGSAARSLPSPEAVERRPRSSGHVPRARC